MSIVFKGGYPASYTTEYPPAESKAVESGRLLKVKKQCKRCAAWHAVTTESARVCVLGHLWMECPCGSTLFYRAGDHVG